MSTEINLHNIKNYIEGNTRAVQKRLGILPEYIQEQVAIRMMKCDKDCIPQGTCINCGCDTPNRLYVTESCNTDRHLDLMEREEWEQYKIDNGII